MLRSCFPAAAARHEHDAHEVSDLRRPPVAGGGNSLLGSRRGRAASIKQREQGGEGKGTDVTRVILGVTHSAGAAANN